MRAGFSSYFSIKDEFRDMPAYRASEQTFTLFLCSFKSNFFSTGSVLQYGLAGIALRKENKFRYVIRVNVYLSNFHFHLLPPFKNSTTKAPNSAAPRCNISYEKMLLTSSHRAALTAFNVIAI